MTSDSGQREPGQRRPDFRLPRVLSVVITLARFEPPKRRNFSSQLPQLDETVAFMVETAGPIPVRALAPSLYVGESPVTEVEAVDETHYRFIALQPEDLQEGAPISLGWSGATARGPQQDRQDTGERFTPPDGFDPTKG